MEGVAACLDIERQSTENASVPLSFLVCRSRTLRSTRC